MQWIPKEENAKIQLFIKSSTFKLGKNLLAMNLDGSENDANDMEAGSSDFNSSSGLLHYFI
jgi:hypothetical protein